VEWYPKSDVDWHPGKPTVGQVAIGAVFFMALAGLSLYWATGESEMGNRIFLWVLAGLLLVLATWRIAIGVRLVQEARRRRRLVRGL
jgi:uncharacterized membrane protein YkgB